MASEKMGIALGMTQTRGLVPAIEASDAITKVSEVQLNSRQLATGAAASRCQLDRKLTANAAR